MSTEEERRKKGRGEPERTTPLTGEQKKIEDKKALVGRQGVAPFDPKHPTTTGRASNKLSNVLIDNVPQTERDLLRRKEEARILSEGGHKSVTPEDLAAQNALDIKQEAELKKIDEMKSLEPQLSIPERNTASGIAALDALIGTVGAEPSGIKPGDIASNFKGGSAVETGLGVVGKIANINIPVIGSFNNMFAKTNSGNIKNLNADVGRNVAEATRITRAATSKGANIQNAIVSLNVLESSIRSKYADAQMALKVSPVDIAEGLDLADDMSFSLRAVTEQRQALERYQLTGDVNQVLLTVGTGINEGGV